MPRPLAALLLAALVAPFAAADVPPPPPPKGKKYVDVSCEVLAAKDLKPGWVMVQKVVTGGLGGTATTFARVDLDDAKPLAVPAAAGKFGHVTLLAVPDDAAKDFKTEKELFDALKAGKVKGAKELYFPRTGTVDEKVKENKVRWTYTVTGVGKDGIEAKASGEGYEVPDKPGDKPAKPVGFEPGYVVGGLAAAAAVCLGGLWLARRRK